MRKIINVSVYTFSRRQALCRIRMTWWYVHVPIYFHSVCVTYFCFDFACVDIATDRILNCKLTPSISRPIVIIVKIGNV